MFDHKQRPNKFFNNLGIRRLTKLFWKIYVHLENGKMFVDALEIIWQLFVSRNRTVIIISVRIRTTLVYIDYTHLHKRANVRMRIRINKNQNFNSTLYVSIVSSLFHTLYIGFTFVASVQRLWRKYHWMFYINIKNSICNVRNHCRSQYHLHKRKYALHCCLSNFFVHL